MSASRAGFAIGAAGVIAALGVALMLTAAVAGFGAGPILGAQGLPESVSHEGASAFALRDIPAEYLRLYRAAGRRFGLDWAILAGVGKVECDHGRDSDPSCAAEGHVNSAGAGGPMQFIASTWATFGVDANGDGTTDRWDPADAVFSAANYLRASGAPHDVGGALFSYNHAGWYVDLVERWAARYRAGTEAQAVSSPPASTVPGGSGPVAASATPVLVIPGERARLAPEDGHLAMIPAGVPLSVQAMLIAGNELQSLPYGPSGHPDPRGATEEDCSSSVNYLLYRAGVRPIAEIVRMNPLAQDYVRWGDAGPGRWVTIYATTAPTNHVFIVVAGLRLDTARNGIDTGPNRFEDGPRWRLLDHIPSWASWSVRHPPGL